MNTRAVVAFTLALLLVAATAWNAGEAHRRNCLTAGRVACSVLPWEDGHPKSGWGTLQGKYGLSP